MRALANFSPLAALALCSGAFFPRKWALVVPLATQILSDIGLHWVGKPHSFDVGYSIVLIVAYALVVVIGWAARKRYSTFKLLGASIVGTLLFYLVTNTFSFWHDPGYAKTLSGWLQCMTVGLPGFPPTYVFLYKSLFGNLLFTSLMVLAFHVTSPTEAGEEPAEPAKA